MDYIHSSPQTKYYIKYCLNKQRNRNENLLPAIFVLTFAMNYSQYFMSLFMKFYVPLLGEIKILRKKWWQSRALRIHIAFVIEDFNLKRFWWVEWYLVHIFFWKKWRVTRVTIDLRAKNGKKCAKLYDVDCIEMVNLTLMCLLGNFNKHIIMWFCWPFQCMFYKLSSYKCYSLTKKRTLSNRYFSFLFNLNCKFYRVIGIWLHCNS